MFTTLKDLIDVRVPLGAVAAGTTDTQNGSPSNAANSIDTAGYDGVLFIAVLGAITATGVATLQVQESDSATTGWGTALTTKASYNDATNGTSAGVTGPSALVLDVYQPLKRYLAPNLVRATANVVIDCILAIPYRGRVNPTTLAAAVLASNTIIQA